MIDSSRIDALKDQAVPPQSHLIDGKPIANADGSVLEVSQSHKWQLAYHYRCWARHGDRLGRKFSQTQFRDRGLGWKMAPAQRQANTPPSGGFD